MTEVCDEINITKYILKDCTPPKLTEPTVEVVFKNGSLGNQEFFERCQDLKFPFAKDNSKPLSVPIKSASILIQAEKPVVGKDIIEIIFDISNVPNHDYAPGDTIAILPHNNENEVRFLLKTMKLKNKSDQPCQIQIHPLNPKKNLKLQHIPEITTPKELLRDILNIRTIPKKQFLRNLAENCTSETERNFLNCLASKEGSKYYNALLLEKGFNMIDLLRSCPSCQPTLPLLIEHLPRLLPRPYSIANNPLENGNELKIIFSKLPENAGITTSMLSLAVKDIIDQNQLKKIQNIFIYPRQTNAFRYTIDDVDNNQILIAIGTGVAPFLSFLDLKNFLIKSKNLTTGDTWLFIGATIQKAIPYRSKLVDLQERGVLQRYYESLSRVSDAECQYVQEMLKKHANEIIEFLLRKKTKIYVCADGAKISQSIELSLNFCLQQELHLSLEEAKEMLGEFRRSGKYSEDLWA